MYENLDLYDTNIYLYGNKKYISDFKKAGDSSSPAFCYIYDVKPLSE